MKCLYTHHNIPYVVFQNKSTQIQQSKPEGMQKDDSPDLFSQDEEQEQINTFRKEPQLSEPILITDSNEIDDGSKMAGDMKMAPENQMASENKMAPENKMASENQMAHTSRLLEEMEKLDEESGQLNLSTNIRDSSNEYSRFFDHKCSTPNKMAHDKMASKETPTSSFTLVNEKSSKQGNTSKVLDSEENSITTSNSKSRKIKMPDSDDDLSKSELSAEVKKKLTRKITDYFSKKST